MKVAISSITENGKKTAQLLNGLIKGSKTFHHGVKGSLKEWVNNNFTKYDAHIFIMSLGIVYRIIQDQIDNKYVDPAVVAVDDARRFSIAALSGHEGGANNLAFRVAQYIDAEPVITTASDTNKNVTIGIGCRKGVEKKQVTEAVLTTLKNNSIELKSVRVAASIEIKRNETGLIEAMKELDIPLLFLPIEKFKTFSGYDSVSETAQKHFDIPGVSEPASILIGKSANLIQKRVKIGPVTVALAKEDLK